MTNFRFLFLFLILPSLATAQSVAPNLLPWILDSETAYFDGKTSTTVYKGLKFSQGNMSVQADEGRQSNGIEENRELKFSGNVAITVNGGRIECDVAELHFSGSVLKRAVVSGSPATFEMQRTSADDTTYAEAGKLEYDVRAGIIAFSEEALITESGNRVSSNYLVYNIRERSFNANSSGDDDRVRITYTPSSSNGQADGEDAVVDPDAQ